MVSAARVDAWVAERLLEAVRPLGIEAALAAIDELERRIPRLQSKTNNCSKLTALKAVGLDPAD
jgi:hypothetical protein